MSKALIGPFEWNRPPWDLHVVFAECLGEPDIEDTYMGRVWPALTPDEIERAKGRTVFYEPEVEAPDLLARFLALPADSHRYADFVRNYGQLGGWHQTVLVLPDPRAEPGPWVPEENLRARLGGELDNFGLSGLGESVIDWELEIEELSIVIAMAGELEAGDSRALEDRIEIISGVARFQDPYAAVSELARQVIDQYMGEPPLDEMHESFIIYRPRDTRAVLCHAFTDQVGGSVIAQAWALLSYVVNEKLAQSVNLDLSDNEAGGRPRLSLNPASLIGYFWLQVAQMISQGPAPRLCLRCSKWFVLNRRGRRRHDTYCSDACRMAMYRVRKKARELHASGLSARTVARRLDMKLSAVRSWL